MLEIRLKDIFTPVRISKRLKLSMTALNVHKSINHLKITPNFASVNWMKIPWLVLAVLKAILLFLKTIKSMLSMGKFGILLASHMELLQVFSSLTCAATICKSSAWVLMLGVETFTLPSFTIKLTFTELTWSPWRRHLSTKQTLPTVWLTGRKRSVLTSYQMNVKRMSTKIVGSSLNLL